MTLLGRPSREPDCNDHPLSLALIEDEREIRETDRPEDQAIVAREKLAKHTAALAELLVARGQIGDELTIARIRESGLCDLATRYVAASYGLVSMDAVCWFATLSYLLSAGGVSRLVLLGLAVLFALGLSHAAQVVLESFLRDVTSVTRTLRAKRRAIWRLGTIVSIGVATFVILALLPSRLSLVVLALAALPTLLCNLCLPLLAAVVRALGHYLEKPARWDQLQYEITIRRAAILRLQRFLPKRVPPDDDTPPPAANAMRVAGIVLLSLAIGMRATGESTARDLDRDACIDFIDPTISSSADDQRVGRDLLVASAFDQVAAFGCRTVGVEVIGSAGRFGQRTWSKVPNAPDERDCGGAALAEAAGERSVVSLFRNVQEGLTEDCEHRLEVARERFRVDAERFRDELRRALATPRTREWSRIRDAIQGAVDSPRARLVVALTDGLENPVGPIDLRVPDGVSVVMIITRPSDPSTYAAVAEAARRWAHVPGVKVYAVGDVGPGFWASVLRER